VYRIVSTKILSNKNCSTLIIKVLKGILHFLLEIGSFYNSLRVKQLSFTVFESIQLIF